MDVLFSSPIMDRLQLKTPPLAPRVKAKAPVDLGGIVFPFWYSGDFMNSSQNSLCKTTFLSIFSVLEPCSKYSLFVENIIFIKFRIILLNFETN